MKVEQVQLCRVVCEAVDVAPVKIVLVQRSSVALRSLSGDTSVGYTDGRTNGPSKGLFLHPVCR